MFREITPLTQDDCFLILDRYKETFGFPLHVHPVYELNFMEYAKGAVRIVGDHVSEIGNIELVMVGPNVFHGWQQGTASIKKKHEVTIQFHQDLFDKTLLSRKMFSSIKHLLMSSFQGIAFSKSTINKVKPIIQTLTQTSIDSVESFTTLLVLFDALSKHLDNAELLNSIPAKEGFADERMQKVFLYIRMHFASKIMIDEIAAFLNMSVVTFARFIKKQTGMTFINLLNEFRINYAIRLMIETGSTIAEITINSGFFNQAHFNREFKLRKGITPSQFVFQYRGSRRTY